MAVEHAHPGTPPIDDPQVEQAMRVYDTLTGDEQREVFRTLYRTVAAWKATSDIDHLVRFAESVDGMVEVEAQPGFQQARRERAQRGLASGGGVDVGKLIGRLRE